MRSVANQDNPDVYGLAPFWLRVCAVAIMCVLAPDVSLAKDDDIPVLDRTAFVNQVERYCIHCHDAEEKKGKLDLESILEADVTNHRELWEKALRKVDGRQMPPVGKRRLSEAGFTALTTYLEKRLDSAENAGPPTVRVDTFRRLSRTEYANVIRDLLALEVDAAALLPADESSHGFDHMTVTDLPPVLLSRYITTWQRFFWKRAQIPTTAAPVSRR